MKILDVYPLSPLQSGMLFHSIQDAVSSPFFLQFDYQIAGALRADLVEAAFNELFRRHDIFRTTFNYEDLKQPVQVLLSERKVDFHFEDLSHLSTAEEQTAALETFKAQDKQRYFLLSKDVLCRIAVFKLGAEQYQLIWSCHHILMDGWCIGILTNEFFVIYQSLLAGQAHQLANPTPYKAYIKWLGQQEEQEALQHWEEYLAGYEALATVPGAAQPTGAQMPHFTEQVYGISQEVSQQIDGLARQNGLTPNALFQVFWSLLLSRYNDQNDVVFGTIVSGRPAEIPQVETIVGLFINAIPVRCQFEENEHLLQIARRMHDQAIEGAPYQYCQLADIQHRTALGQSLLDHQMVFENYPLESAIEEMGAPSDPGETQADDGLSVPQIEVYEQLNYPFTLVIAPTEGGYQAKFRYNEQVYTPAQIERMIGHYEQVIQQFVAQPETPVAQIEMLTATEKQQLLYEFNQSELELPPYQAAHQLFEEAVRTHPDKEALIWEGGIMTYAELNVAANRLAHYLRETEQVQANQLVNLMTEKNQWGIISMLAIWKAGAGFVAIDPHYPADRIQHIIQDSAAQVLLCDQPYEKAAEFHRGKTLILPALFAELQTPTDNPSLINQPSDISYIIYTSGSTGKPKGAVNIHEGTINLYYSLDRLVQVHPEDRVLQFASFSFDVSVLELVMGLMNGSGLVLTPQNCIHNGDLFVEFLNKQQVSVMFLTPAYLNTLDKSKMQGVRAIMTGGEDARPEDAVYFGTRIIYHNVYGPAECAVIASGHLVNQADAHRRNIPIGPATANAQILLLDSALRPVPIGTTGEICIAGTCVGRGYLNNPELTAQKYLSLQVGDERLQVYRSGDLARWWEDGNFEFMGRKDTQIKIRGQRVELGEVNGALMRHPAIEDGIVIARKDTDGTQLLIAYYTCKQAIAETDLRDYLTQCLPVYMVPTFLVALERFPLSPNNKIDRKALLARPIPRQQSQYEAPVQADEKALAQIWKEVLGHVEPGLRDDFFALGGHSIKVVKLTARIYKQFGLRLSIKDIFKAPTLSEQAALIQAAQGPAFEAIPAAARQNTYPLSYGQKRLWVLDQFEGGNLSAYHISRSYVLENLAPDLFEAALWKLLERHESLRTNIVVENGVPRQWIQDPEVLNFQLERHDLRRDEPEIAQQFIRETSRRRTETPFDLAQDPLIRITLFQTEDQQFVALLVMHHIIADGWSMDIFHRDLMHYYESLGNSVAPALPTLSIQYKDYAVWSQGLSEEAAWEKHQAYWKAQFTEEIPVLDVASDFPRPVHKSYRGAERSFWLEPTELQVLQQLARKHDASLYMVLMALLNGLLYKYTGQTDIVVGSPIAGRAHPDLENQIGFFVNTLAIRTRFDEQDSFVQLLQQTRERVLGAFEHQDYPFDKLVEELNIPRDTSRLPLFDVMLVLQNTEEDQATDEQSTPSSNLSVQRQDEAESVSQYDLAFTFQEMGPQLHANLRYCTDLFRQETIDQLIRHFRQLLAAVIDQPTQALSQLSVLHAAEQEAQLQNGKGKELAGPSFRGLQELLEYQAARQPYETALSIESRSLSYQQWNNQANQLAHLLQDRYQLKPGQLVGILRGRTEEALVSILAVLKAGAAYLPIDPAYPAERVSYLVSDAAPSLILTEPALAASLQQTDPACPILTDYLKGKEAYPTTKPEISVDPEQLAYIIYTSGSTGKPKGVAISHRSALKMLDWAAQEFAQTQFSAIVACTSFCFDLSIYELFFGLRSGKPIHLLSSALELADHLAQASDLLVNTVPSVVADLVQRKVSLAAITALNMAGEVIPQSLIAALELEKMEVRNLYGPSEDTTYSTCFRFTRADEPVLIGRPLPDTQALLLNESQQLVPFGAKGEIALAGGGLALGYLNQPELTAQKFIDHPYEVGKKLYLTGDLGRWNKAKQLHFLGRKDQQIKLRGYRIELGEISSCLEGHPQVEKAWVQLYQAGEKAPILVAYFSPNTLVPEQLRTFAETQLPGYMVPGRWMALEAFPLNANGKIDPKALPTPEVEATSLAKVDATTETEKKLVQIWEELLQVSPIGIEQNFFHLGGHSLLATQLVALIAQEFGVQLTLKDVFDHPTIQSLSKVIDNARWLLATTTPSSVFSAEEEFVL